MKTNRRLLFFTFLYFVIQGFIYKYIFHNEMLLLIPDILAMLLGWRTYKIKSTQYNKNIAKYLGKNIPIVLWLYFILSIVGTFINSNTIMTYIWGARIPLRYGLLFWASYKNFTLRDLEKIKNWIYKVFFFNIFVCVIQFIIGLRGDIMTGTMDGNGTLMMLCILTYYISIGDYFSRTISLKRFSIISILMFFVAIGAEIKFMYFLFPLIFYGGYVLMKKFNVGHIVTLVVAFIFLIPTMQYFIAMVQGDEYAEKIFTTEFIEEETTHAYSTHKGGINRNTAIELTSIVILTDPVRYLVGYGIGSGSISKSFKTEVSEIYGYTGYSLFSTSYCLVEMGWLGLVLYALFYTFLLLRFYKQYRRTDNKDLQYWATLGILSLATSYITFWYNDNPYVKYNLIVMFWGICFAGIELNKKNHI